MSRAASHGAIPGAGDAGSPAVGKKLVAKSEKSPCSSTAACALGRGTPGARSRTTRCRRSAALGALPIGTVTS